MLLHSGISLTKLYANVGKRELKITGAKPENPDEYRFFFEMLFFCFYILFYSINLRSEKQ